MKMLSSYFLQVIATALFGAVLKGICPEKGAGKVLRFAVSLALILSIVSPVMKLQADDISAFLSQTLMMEEHARTGVEIPNADLAAQIISRKTATYVLDKANALGAEIEVEVSMHTGGSYPYPEAIRISGALNTQQRQELQRFIEDSFAIPADRQVYDQ